MQLKFKVTAAYRWFASAQVLAGLAVVLACSQVHAKMASRPIQKVVHASQTVATVRVIEAKPLSDGKSKDGCGYLYRVATVETLKGRHADEIRFRMLGGLTLAKRYLLFLPGKEELKTRMERISGPLWFEYVSESEKSCHMRYASVPTLENYAPQDLAEFDDSMSFMTDQEWIEITALEFPAEIEIHTVSVQAPKEILGPDNEGREATYHRVAQFSLVRELILALP